MMGGGTAAQDTWVERVLGIRLTPALSPSREAWQRAQALWLKASDTVDSQIAALQSALRNSDDDTLEEIAESGLNGLTGNYRVRLMAALREVDPATPAAAQRTLALSREFASFLQASEALEVCDENPYGVPVSIRATLGDALRQIGPMLNGLE